MSQFVEMFGPLLLWHLLVAVATGMVLCALLLRAALAGRRTPVRIVTELPPRRPLANIPTSAPADVMARFNTRGPPLPSPSRRLSPAAPARRSSENSQAVHG